MARYKSVMSAAGLAFLGVFFVTVSCGSSGSLGQPISSAKVTSIDDVIRDPAVFAGKDVVVQGQIATVDGDGKGFNLDNGRSALLYCAVDGDWKISTVSRYRLATAEGIVDHDAKTGKTILRARGVKIK
jgi:hypothetical protein